MSVPPQQMAPATAPAPASEAPMQGGGMEEKIAALEGVDPAVKVVILTCHDIIEQQGEDLVGQLMQASKSVAIGLSQGAFALIMGAIAQVSAEAEAEVGEKAGINPASFVGDGGPGELVLARLFGVAEQMGVEGANDESEYVTAGDALDLLLEMAEQGGQGDPEAGMAAMQGGEAPPAAPPQGAPAAPGAGWRSQA